MANQVKPKIVIVLENLRSIHNVGAIIRTANGFGVHDFIFIGTTPYPHIPNDARQPFMARKQTQAIHKTALGAEEIIDGKYYSNTAKYLKYNSKETIVAIEQSQNSITPIAYKQNNKNEHNHLVLGNEVNGTSKEILLAAKYTIEIPMQSTKESFNVEVAAAIVLYELRSLA